MERIGVIGLGRMGSAIAQRYGAQGHAVTGWTRSRRAVDGVAQADDLPELAATSDTLILSLFDDAAVASMLDALLACDLTGKQIIDTSTVVPALIKDRIGAITAKGASAVDAPISGGPDMVLAGSCGVFIGGTDAGAARATQTLGAISGRIFHVGPLGTGLIMKVINNGMLQAYFTGLSDLIPLARRSGLSLETALRILCGGPAGIPMLTARIPKVLGQDSGVGFTIDAARKDSEVFRRVLHAFGLQSAMLDAFQQRQTAAIAAGLGEMDVAALIAAAYAKD